MRIHFYLACLVLLLMFYFNSAFAGVNDDLNNYFNGLGFSSNVTSPQAYHGQQAGFYTGGSLFMRSPVRDVQIVQLDLPSYRSGCSGIDMYAGGFSFIDNDQVVQLLQNLMNHSASYAFTLAMETATPELANVMKYWNDLAQKINQANINSCEAAEGLVGGMWPRVRGAQQRVCQDIGSSGGVFSDWAQAKQKCGMGNGFSSTMDKARNDPHYKNFVFDSGNIVWKAIKQNNLISGDDELAEFFMSLSGTIIISKMGSGDDAPVKFNPPLPSLMDKENNNLIQKLLHGGEVTLYRCDTIDVDGCLNPKANLTITISKEKGFANRIRQLLDSMVNKIIDDTALSEEEIGLLQQTSLPIYKMLNVQVAFAKNKDILHIPDYAEAVATDIIYQYLGQILQTIRNSIASSQSPEELLAKLQPNIDKELEQLRDEQKNAYTRMATSIQLIQQTQVIERMLASDLSTELASNLSWAKGLHS